MSAAAATRFLLALLIMSVPGVVTTGFLLAALITSGSSSDRVLFGVFSTTLRLTRSQLNIMWNDTDVPLAYLITFRSYGTWLHGDKRGSIDRFNNRYNSPYIPPNKNWLSYNKKNLKGSPFIMKASHRKAVEFAIRDTCTRRNWGLLAVSVRTNHAHTVVRIGSIKSERALNALKANATREMRERGLWTPEYSPWAEKGSKRPLWNEKSIERAIDYALNGQGDELPDLD